VNVLQNAVRVGAGTKGVNFKTQVLSGFFTPGGGKIFRFKSTRDKLLFQLKAQNHMEGVTYLVSVNADKRGFDLVYRAVKVSGVYTGALFREKVP